jgi:hypothetical protein
LEALELLDGTPIPAKMSSELKSRFREGLVADADEADEPNPPPKEASPAKRSSFGRALDGVFTAGVSVAQGLLKSKSPAASRKKRQGDAKSEN